MRKKRLVAAILCLCMLLPLPPGETAVADGERDAIENGPGGLQPYDRIIFAAKIIPLPWLVLPDTGEDRVLYETETSGNVLPLLSEYLVDTAEFQKSFTTGDYPNSSLKKAFATFMEDYFSRKQQSVVKDTTLIGSSMDSGANPLSAQKLFPLSYNEFERLDSAYRQAVFLNVDARDWWLRTSYDDSNRHAWHVTKAGTLGYNFVDSQDYLRPAMHLDKDAILFVSEAEGGKETGTGSDVLKAVGKNETGKWKLTLLDPDNYFGATLHESETGTIRAGARMNIVCHSMMPGENVYVSAMLIDSSGSIRYYGRLREITSSDQYPTIGFNIPVDAPPGAYTLKVFSEQYNGDNLTDYAGRGSGLPLTVTEAWPTATLVTVSPSTASVVKGNTRQFSATVEGISSPAQDVTWSVEGASSADTHISTDGLLSVGGDEPESATITVKATSTVTPTVFGTAAVTVTVPPPTVSVTPSGSVRFPLGNAPGDAVFTVTSSDGVLNATNNFLRASLEDNVELALGTVGTPGTEGSVADGSLVVTVNRAKLNTLAPGSHTLTVMLRDFPVEQATGVITVIDPGGGGGDGESGANVPKTGDGSLPGLWLLLLLLAGAGLTASACQKHGKRKTRPE